MPEVVISQLWILPRFADIHRYPTSIREKFRPAMIALDRALVLVGRNGGANGETSRYPDAARESNEVGMKIGAIARAHIASVHRVATAPASSRLVVPHSSDHVIIE